MSEASTAPNPYLDFRLTARVTPPGSTTSFDIPGFFAADGSQGDPCTGEIAPGRAWKVRFTPENVPGSWTVVVYFEQGVGSDGRPINVSDDPVPSIQGTAPFVTTAVQVVAFDPQAPGFYGKGILRNVPFHPDLGGYYLKFSNPALPEERRHFVATGTGSPENFLAYREFYKSDKAPASLGGLLHTYERVADGLPTNGPTHHETDWDPGDPVWATTYLTRSGSSYSSHFIEHPSCPSTTSDGAGRGILGALRYLESKGVNSIYLLPLNLGGDGRDVHPFADVPMADIGGTCPTVTPSFAALNYSVKRMQEWTTVLQFAAQRGIMVNMVLWEQEQENLEWLGYGPGAAGGPYSCANPPPNGELTWARRLYLKQMAAYFGHLHGLKWTLCEEATDPAYYMPNPNPPPNPMANHAETFTIAEINAIVGWLKRWDSYHDHGVTLHTDGNEYRIYQTVLQNAGGTPPAEWLRATSLQMGNHENQAFGSTGWTPGKPAAEYHSYSNTVEAVRQQFLTFGGTVGGVGRKVVIDVDEQGGWIRGASGSSDFPNRAQPGTYSSYLSSAEGRRRCGLYDILFSGGNVSWYAGWTSTTNPFLQGNELHGGGDLTIDEFRSRELLWEYSLAARQRLQSVRFWLGSPNDARVTGEQDDNNPAESFGGAEVLESLDISGPPENNFHLIYYPQGFVPGSGGGAGQFKFGGVDMNYQPNAGATYVAFFVDPRTNVIFADSRKNFARSDLNATGGMYLPAASAAMIAAAGAAAPNQLHDFVLVIRRISDG